MTYNFKDCIKDNTFPGLQFQLKVNGVAKDLTGSTVILNLDGKVFLTTSNGSLIYSDISQGKFQLPKMTISLASKIYQVDISFNFADGEKRTYLTGTWNILPKPGHNTY